MSKKQVYLIAGVIVMIIFIFIGLFFEVRDVPDHSWLTKYDVEEKDPPDAYVFAQLLEERFGKDAVKIKGDTTILDSTTNKQLYISIGSSIRYNREDQESLVKFIEAGNDAVLISSTINFDIPVKMTSIAAEEYSDKSYLDNESGFDVFEEDNSFEEYKDESNDEDVDYEEENDENYNDDNSDQEENNYNLDVEEKPIIEDSIIKEVDIGRYLYPYHKDTIVEFSFMPFDSVGSVYIYTHYGREFDMPINSDYNYFTPYESIPRVPIIFTKDAHHIFCKIKVGKGSLYIHTIPELFTNAATRQSFYLDHFNKVFSPFEVDMVIIDKPDPLSYLFDKRDQKSPLQYILSVPTLSWAYYLLLATMILFVIFRGKRTQRIIPTIEKNKNTSLDYIKTLSVLHQNQEQNSKLIKHVREGFFHRVKMKYFLDHKDEFFKEKLAAKSKIELAEIENLLHKLNSTGGAEFSDDQLITLYKQIESFYKKAA